MLKFYAFLFLCKFMTQKYVHKQKRPIKTTTLDLPVCCKDEKKTDREIANCAQLTMTKLFYYTMLPI